MSEKRIKQSGAATNASQNYDYLWAMPADEILDEFADVVGQMTEESYDPAVIDTYLSVLDEKDSMDMSIDVEKEWKEFSRAHGLATSDSPHERKVIRFGRVRRLAIIATAVAIMMTLTVSAGAIGLHYFWDKLEWDEEHFSFGDAQYAEEVQETDAPYFENWDEDKVYGSLQEALDDFGITEFAEPSWLPEGYELDEVEVISHEESNELTVSAWYGNGENFFYAKTIYTPPGSYHNTQYQVDGDSFEEYNCGEYTCLLFNNLYTKKAVWLTENYECTVTGWLSFDEIKMIIDSIYLEE